ncbi:MAG: carbohydrate ABC transporter permease [Clostridiales bacterium]|uniref:Carbohydrate ABC transporter membrane protein 2 (CUT1 family) n=1 Tax=Harryflintia acetispora TaxID=1849041 RepID=A0A9X8UH41_9FIRM|nr:MULTISPECIES: carbohydrate ABC transporter permease [Oscillospiraceae]PWM38353.1 MAG: carbohydrate ABC transporter permease [Clostridiales bacterium]RGB63173.1 carbohydrate ABC transporter permease [Harryflintia acetispora]TCL41841.1 carbohydrate ABC transporter membrane protein 2 (CUT1 family) [Harryflintia acetispora]
MSAKTRKQFFKVFWIVVGVVCFLIMMFPLYWMISCSLKTESEIFARPPYYFPPNPNLDAYITQLSNVEQFPIINSFKNSMIISLATMAISVVLSTMASYGLARFNIKGKNLIIFLFLVSQMLPQVFTLVPDFIIFKSVGIYNTYWAPIFANCTVAIPFSILMLRTYFLSIPKEVDDAALIDGCNHFQSFLKIMMPMASTGIVVSFVFSFLFGYADMMFSLTFINDSRMWPVTTGIYNVVGRYGIEWSRAMAFGCLAVAPVVLIFLLMERYIVEGLASGAVKG